MDAKIAEIKSKFNTAISNGNTVGAAYEHAIESGLDDDVFHAMITGVPDLVEMSTMKATEWLKRISVPGFPQFISFKAEEEANEALKESETALKKMQVAFTAAPERKMKQRN